MMMNGHAETSLSPPTQFHGETLVGPEYVLMTSKTSSADATSNPIGRHGAGGLSMNGSPTCHGGQYLPGAGIADLHARCWSQWNLWVLVHKPFERVGAR
jgi:hypothetical protein